MHRCRKQDEASKVLVYQRSPAKIYHLTCWTCCEACCVEVTFLWCGGSAGVHYPEARWRHVPIFLHNNDRYSSGSGHVVGSVWCGADTTTFAFTLWSGQISAWMANPLSLARLVAENGKKKLTWETEVSMAIWIRDFGSTGHWVLIYTDLALPRSKHWQETPGTFVWV